MEKRKKGRYKYDNMEEKGTEKIISSITHFGFT
jgi:hypothetical protein